MKISLIHDWLRVNAGSEKVVREILSLYADKDIELYTLFNKLPLSDRREILQNKSCHTSILQRLPGIESYYKSLLPILPFFMSRFKIRESDVYITSSHAIAKGARIPKGKLHICYCHTPMRYAWYLHQDYMQQLSGAKKWLAQKIMPFIKAWDLKTSAGVTHFIANSKHIQQQILSIYGRQSTVIYPPVQTDKFTLNASPRKDFYLAVGRFVPYKKMDTIIQAFMAMPDKKLVLIGESQEGRKISKWIGASKNIVWLGYQHDDELLLYMQNAKACLFAAKEDFGIMCVEVQSTGTPVLALRYGGYCETVREGLSGYFFNEQSAEAIQEAVTQFESSPLQNHTEIHTWAQQFSVDVFNKKFSQFIEKQVFIRT
jgi:glycosyltransferase involved in cell wall biosynthesis